MGASTDHSGVIIDEYKKYFPKIKAIHLNKNLGSITNFVGFRITNIIPLAQIKEI